MPDQQQFGPPLGNVATPDAYLRIKQNIDGIVTELASVKDLASASNPLTAAQLDQLQKELQAGGKNPLNLTALPGVLLQAQPIIEGTHANRLTKPASNYAIGTGFLETDTDLLYEVQNVNNARTWVAVGAGPIYRGTHATRGSGIYSATVLPLGETFFESDRTVAYQVTSGPVWTYSWGIMQAGIASRPVDLTTTDAGFLFLATDLTVLYRWSGTAWFYVMGVYSAATASRPATLGTGDAGFLFIDTTLNVLEHWTGAAWVTIGSAPTTQVLAYKDVTGGYTVLATDFQVVSTNSGAETFGMPDSTTVPGQVFAIKNSSTSTGALSVNAFSGQNIDGFSGWTFAPGEGFIVASDGTTNLNVLAVIRLSVAGICLQGLGNGSQITLTGTYQSLGGCSVTLNRTGLWLIQAIIDYESTGINQFMIGQLLIGSTPTGATTPYLGVTAGIISAPSVQTWLYTAASTGLVASLQARNSSGTGGTVNNAAGLSSITATWIHA